jgi:uncharacterized Zn finger protein
LEATYGEEVDVMECPKCGARNMSVDQPVYFNKDNQEGGYLYQETVYRCRICGKMTFLPGKVKASKKKFVKGQVITGGYENL